MSLVVLRNENVPLIQSRISGTFVIGAVQPSLGMGDAAVLRGRGDGGIDCAARQMWAASGQLGGSWPVVILRVPG